MRTSDVMNQASAGDMVGGLMGMKGASSPSNVGVVMPFDIESYSRLVQQISKIYSPYDQVMPTHLPLALTAPHALSQPLGIFSASADTVSSKNPAQSTLSIINTSAKNKNERPSPEVEISPRSNSKSRATKSENKSPVVPAADSEEHALDLSTQGLRSLYSSYKRINLDQVKTKVVEDLWVENDIALSWTDSKVAAYNPAQKLFMCVDCECVGFLSRVAEHWLGAHANLRVFHCPRCPYTSAWSRCVKMHLTRQHNEQFADTTMWKENSTLLEVTRLMQELRTKVETRIDCNSTLADKRFYCPHCPYATDRRDLYTRHENIHKDNKPFHCYLCFKQFNRADHVKKHFVRMHPDTHYDISKIRKQPGTPSSGARGAGNNNTTTSNGVPVSSPSSGPQSGTPTSGAKPSCTIEPKGVIVNPTGNASISSPGSNPPPSSLLATVPSSKTTPITGPSPPTPMPALAVAALAPPPSLPPIPGEGSPASPGVVLTAGTDSPEPGTQPRGRRRGGTERAYTCPYCHWSGTDNWCLKRHMNTHIKPFACIMCDYKAARAERLSTHVWKVHNKRICNKCNFLADTQEALLQHTREEQ